MTKAFIPLFVMLFASAARAQTAVPYPMPGQPWHQPQVFVPSVTTAVTTSDSLLGHLHLANTSGSTVTITMTDGSTACGGGVCQFWPAITIAANTVYENDFGGMLCTGGVKWSAGTGSAVEGWIKGTYVQSAVAALSPPELDWLKKYAIAMKQFEPEPGTKPVNLFPR